MAVELVRVTEGDKSVLANLVQLYRYDFSPIRDFELTEHGAFVYRFLDLYFVDDGRTAWFIRHRGRLAGFAMVLVEPDGTSEVAEFWVARNHRRSGVGRAAAHMVFALRPGRWEVAIDLANDEAVSFWPPVVDAAAIGTVERTAVGPPERTHRQTVLRFSTL
jgi:predicted acetyltransferase